MKWKSLLTTKVSVFSAILFLSFSSSAQIQKIENSLFWEISGNGLKHPSYLFGTIHIICKDDFKLSETAKQKIKGAHQLFLELDMDDPALQATMMREMQLPKGNTLKNIFGVDQFSRLDAFMQREMKMSPAALNQFKPMMLMSLLTQRMLPCMTPESYELNFMKLAKAQNIEVLGLERIEDQVAVFDAIPDSLEVKGIMDMVNDFDKQKTNLSRMISYYKDESLNELYRFMMESPDMMGSQEILLDRRNRNWIPLMENAMQKGSIFFAVGAAHLPGKAGVIELLREKGYKVSAIK